MESMRPAGYATQQDGDRLSGCRAGRPAAARGDVTGRGRDQLVLSRATRWASGAW